MDTTIVRLASIVIDIGKEVISSASVLTARSRSAASVDRRGVPTPIGTTTY